MSSADFTSIPILEYGLLARDRAAFLSQLRHALIHVGFLYLRGAPVDTTSVIAQIPRVFALPQSSKDALSMRNSEHFLGYTNLGTEFTKGALDMREQFDFATPHQNEWKEGDPEYLRLWGPAQWPSDEELPGFREVVEKFYVDTDVLAHDFTGLVVEALGLSHDALSDFFEPPGHMQHRGKIIKYPEVKEGASNQGVGPHYDSGFLTFLLQASEQRGLQVQNFAGKWIDVPPLADTFVVNIGKGLEALTSGIALATSHRVLSPPPGSGPRYSVPFFQMIAQRVVLGKAAASLTFPPDVLAERDRRGNPTTDSVNYTEYDTTPAGEVALIGRIKSHPDVAERHYPQLFKAIFPQGLPREVSAY
ncbi:Clavaminate synthase-like protein [Exidia glandulosa HHB12029]|uniref:Clavaminate synthase-like protein n=1 Tax=Exidia glandulosa HHB12029 TaxID=1314781 RepID=A0A165P9V1_EXIGL|nr:Clavaminate synthase-like protein [Exidia glandulosa HHB12029]